MNWPNTGIATATDAKDKDAKLVGKSYAYYKEEYQRAIDYVNNYKTTPVKKARVKKKITAKQAAENVKKIMGSKK